MKKQTEKKLNLGKIKIATLNALPNGEKKPTIATGCSFGPCIPPPAEM